MEQGESLSQSIWFWQFPPLCKCARFFQMLPQFKFVGERFAFEAKVNAHIFNPKEENNGHVCKCLPAKHSAFHVAQRVTGQSWHKCLTVPPNPPRGYYWRTIGGLFHSKWINPSAFRREDRSKGDWSRQTRVKMTNAFEPFFPLQSSHTALRGCCRGAWKGEFIHAALRKLSAVRAGASLY